MVFEIVFLETQEKIILFLELKEDIFTNNFCDNSLYDRRIHFIIILYIHTSSTNGRLLQTTFSRIITLFFKLLYKRKSVRKISTDSFENSCSASKVQILLLHVYVWSLHTHMQGIKSNIEVSQQQNFCSFCRKNDDMRKERL